MQAYLYDNENFYLGTTSLQESPLEPGVYFDQPNSTRIAPPSYGENEIPVWNGSSWEIRPNYSNITFYHKSTREEKKYEIGETPDLDTYTELKPLENESFQKWDEASSSWSIDLVAKAEQELKIRQSQIRSLLLYTDYIELPSFLERKGQAAYNSMMSYRASLRTAFHNPALPMPEAPEV